jgi:hypothetical protein
VIYYALLFFTGAVVRQSGNRGGLLIFALLVQPGAALQLTYN